MALSKIHRNYWKPSSLLVDFRGLFMISEMPTHRIVW